MVNSNVFPKNAIEYILTAERILGAAAVTALILSIALLAKAAVELLTLSETWLHLDGL